VPERLIELEGGSNFRDIGGYPVAGGGQVRWGRVYRSAALNRLTARDVATVDRLGLRVVYDLRASEECEASPSILPVGIRTESLPIGGGAATLKGLGDLIVDGKLTYIPDDFLVRIYAAMIEDAAATFGRLLTMLAVPGETPALFHCTAGKDRTGLSAALLLSVLGVDDELILDDYVLSAVHYSDQQLEKLRQRVQENSSIDPDRYRVIFDAPRDAMATALALIRARSGSVRRYLVEVAGVEPAVFDELRSQLTESL
jgi:protein-tyrosine phosphatase